MNDDTCCFCNRTDLSWRTVHESEHFLVAPALGHFVEGYLLIIPKEHYIAVADIPQAIQQEFIDVRNHVRQLLVTHYTPPIFFEHGPLVPRRDGGNCVEHAHWHCVPSNVDLGSLLTPGVILEGREFIDLPQRENSGILAQLEDYAALFCEHRDKPYLFTENNQGKRTIFFPRKPVVRQHFRRLLAQQLNVPDEWDWVVYPHTEKLEQCVTRLIRERCVHKQIYQSSSNVRCFLDAFESRVHDLCRRGLASLINYSPNINENPPYLFMVYHFHPGVILHWRRTILEHTIEISIDAYGKQENIARLEKELGLQQD